MNANVGFSNMPNLDLVALKGACRVGIQVKAATANDNVPLAGGHRPEDRYFNAKEGPLADFVVAVQLHRPAKAQSLGRAETCYVLPVAEANRVAVDFGVERARKLKRDGTVRSANFPIWIPAAELAGYCEAWSLMEAATTSVASPGW